MLSNQSTRSLTTLVYSMQLLRGGTSQWKGEVFDLLGWSQLSPGFIVPNTFIARFVLGERLHPQLGVVIPHSSPKICFLQAIICGVKCASRSLPIDPSSIHHRSIIDPSPIHH